MNFLVRRWLALAVGQWRCFHAPLKKWPGILGSSFLPVFFSFGGLTMPILATAQNEADPLADIVAPDIERREIKRPRIDKENWEIGLYGGLMTIEDFGSNTLYGARLTYHITEGFFTELSYGETRAGETSFETLSGSTEILSDEQRDLTYYSANLGYNLFQGEFFLGSQRAYQSNVYLIAGAGNTEFAEDEYFTYSLGGGAQIFFTDWFSMHADVRAYSFTHELLGAEKRIVNLEPSLGLSIFF